MLQKGMNKDVSSFLDNLNHPLRAEIDAIRELIVNSNFGLIENIKWNAPNYSKNGEDRITMRIHPPKNVQLIFHRGAKKQVTPDKKIIDDPFKLLIWKENDRAIMTFNNFNQIENKKNEIVETIKKWIENTF